MISASVAAARFAGMSLVAFVVFDGATGTVRSQSNVASVTLRAQGQWTINFANALASTNYIAEAQTLSYTWAGASFQRFTADLAPTVNALALSFCVSNPSGFVNPDSVYVGVYA